MDWPSVLNRSRNKWYSHSDIGYLLMLFRMFMIVGKIVGVVCVKCWNVLGESD